MQKWIGKVLGMLVVLSIIPTLAFAGTPGGDIPFSLGQPRFAGNGCPDANSAVAVLSDDGKELSILFNEWTAETEGRKRFDSSNCNVAVPINNIEPGITVGLLGVDYRGLAYIPEGGMGLFSREYFFAGMRGPRTTSRIGVKDEFYEFFYPDTLLLGAASRCGEESVIARSNATLMVRKPRRGNEEAFMSMFSEDWDLEIVFHLDWDYCR